MASQDKYVRALTRRKWVMGFQKALIAWGKNNRNSFPWRKKVDPYSTLMAEIMLHRTQAAQVKSVYKNFIKHYPTLTALTSGSRRGIRTILKPLGLTWRINAVFKMSRVLQNKFNGTVPKQKGDLLGLPGVGDYIANAVRCFAWSYPEPLVDTNTVRVVGRVFGLKTKDSSRRTKVFREIIAKLVSTKKPREFNYSLIDLAHNVCHKSKDPECNICPLLRYCSYGKNR